MGAYVRILARTCRLLFSPMSIRPAHNDIKIRYHEDATSVVLVVAHGEYWLWFTTGPERRIRPQIISRDEVGDVPYDISDAAARTYLEVRMKVAGYKVKRTAIQSRDIAVWDIASD